MSCPDPTSARGRGLKRTRTNFGRTETVDSSKLHTLIDADLDDSRQYTLYVDTKQVTQAVDAAPQSGGQLVPNARVVAVVEVGSGHGVARTVFDATDLLVVPIAGDHVKVDVTLEDPSSAPNNSSSSSASPIFLPNFGSPASSAAQAQVSAFISEGVKGYAAQPDFFAYMPPAVATANVQVVSSAPCRLMGFTALNPNAASTLFLFFVSTPTTTIPTQVGPSPFVPPGISRGVFPLPVGVVVQPILPGSLPFDRGFTWAVSSTSDVFTQSASKIRVDPTLLRRPIVQVVNSIPKSAGQ